MSTRILAAFAVLAAVSSGGCVSGGMDAETRAALQRTLASVEELTDLWKKQLAAAGGETPTEPAVPTEPVSSGAIEAHLNQMIDAADTALHASPDGSNTLGYKPRWEPTVHANIQNLNHDDLHYVTTLFDNQYERINDREGVSFAWAQHSYKSVGTTELHRYAGWLEESFFLVSWRLDTGNDRLNPHKRAHVYLYSIGDTSGTNPVTGSATWTGAMTGIDVSNGFDRLGSVIEGDATLTIGDLASPEVDLAFTNLRDRTLNRSRPDIEWTDVPLSAGRFEGDGLVGHFYGTRHQEVGGIFLRDRISGAFGAKRQ